MDNMGIDPTQVWASTDTPPWGLGDVVFNKTSAGEKGYVFVQDSGSGITGDGYVCIMDGSAYTAAMVTDTLSAPGAGQGKLCGVARAAIAASGYGWLQIYGPGTIRTLTLCAAYTQLTTSATAGTLDDATTAGLEVVDGMALDTATGGATANTAGWLNWPKIGRTL